MRLAQTRERDGRPWSQDDFVDALEEETGYKLYRPNYSGYETGATDPEPETVEKLLTFWRQRKVTPPKFAAPEPPLTDSERTIRAMDRQTAAIDRQTAMLGAVLMKLAGPQMSPELEAFVEANWPGSEPTPLRPQRVPQNG